MLVDIIEVKTVRSYVLYIRFANGVSGEVDISQVVPFEGIFSKLFFLNLKTSLIFLQSKCIKGLAQLFGIMVQIWLQIFYTSSYWTKKMTPDVLSDIDKQFKINP